MAESEAPIVTRNRVGKGAVIVVLVPRLSGQDERAHPVLPHLLADLTAGLLPVEIVRADGTRPDGEVLYQINRTSNGYLVLLMSTRGVDKTPSGVARVDRRAVANVALRTSLPLKSVKEYTIPRALTVEHDASGRSVVYLSIAAGDLAVVALESP
jgi:hypothetical protein